MEMAKSCQVAEFMCFFMFLHVFCVAATQDLDYMFTDVYLPDDELRRPI